jgi:homocitrate synthase
MFKGLIDTTFRDGQQSPLMFDSFKYRFNINEKKKIFEALVKLGIRHFEFFSPVVSPIENKDFQELLKFSKQITKEKIFFLAHCRCHPKDIKEAIKAGFDGLNLYMGISKHAQKYHFKKTKEELFKIIKDIIIKTKKAYPNIYLRFSAEDFFRTSLEDIFEIYDQIHKFVDTFGVPDTVGIATPDEVEKIIKILKKRYPEKNIECHFHDDRGYALINAQKAVENGAEFIDTSVWGIAERSGITSCTGLLLNLYHLDKKLVKNYNLNICYPLNILLGSILKIQVPFKEPVSLTNRTHTAGVHQKAILNSKKSYEAHKLEIFGVNKKNILLGPLSGWHLIYYYTKEILSYEIDESQAKEITKIYKKNIYQIKKNYSPEKVLLSIIKKFQLKKRRTQSKIIARLENLTN